MREADLFLLVARLTATIGRIVFLARMKRRNEEVLLMWSLLKVLCQGMEAIEKALQEKEGV